jgi:hypothetical protein
MLGPGPALAATIPLINGAFATSEPVRAYASLLGLMRTAHADHPEVVAPMFVDLDPARWRHVVKQLLDMIEFEASAEDAKILGSRFHRIAIDNWLHAEINDSPIDHPFLSRDARIWDEWAREANVDDLIDSPGAVARDTRESALERIYPFTIIRFHSDDRSDRVLTRVAGWMSEDQDRLNALNMLTIYGAIRRASGAHFDADHRTCHHRECPEWDPNYCNSYPAVPPAWEDCGFPATH